MSKYSMSSTQDLKRLEKQNDQKQYCLENELQYLGPNHEEIILDAGCGSGLVTRSMAKMFSHKNVTYHACDYSEVAVAGAIKIFEFENIKVKTFQSSIDNIEVQDDVYDKVICRYVLEHMHDPQKATNEFFRVLKPNGVAYLIDVDGIVFNLFSENDKLNNYLNCLKNNFKFDLFIGRKLTHLLKRSGFQEISWHASMMSFETQDQRDLEIQNYVTRFNLAKPIIANALGGEKYFQDFVQTYLNELNDLRNPLCYTKFIAVGKK